VWTIECGCVLCCMKEVSKRHTPPLLFPATSTTSTKEQKSALGALSLHIRERQIFLLKIRYANLRGGPYTYILDSEIVGLFCKRSLLARRGCNGRTFTACSATQISIMIVLATGARSPSVHIPIHHRFKQVQVDHPFNFEFCNGNL